MARLRVIALLPLVALTGCLAAAAAAGAGGGIYLTSRGVESQLPLPIAVVARKTESAWRTLLIEQTASATKASGAERTYNGTTGELTITVDLRRTSDSTTRIEVRARRNLATWDKDYARQVLDAVVAAP